MPRVFVMSLLFLLCGCSPYGLPPASSHDLPPRISDLRLYADLRAGVVRDDARPYAPSFALWSDGASKRRWIRLPPGTTIDSSDIDAWRFPVGTELFKEFALAGKRIETRVLRKVTREDDGWAAMSYAWNVAQTEALAAPDGIEDALGTKLDVPSARTCMACHGGRPERVLGFGAIQLAHAPKLGEEATDREVTLERLVAEHRLSAPPSSAVVVPGTAADAAAIGYLHANCGHCHNGGRARGLVHAPDAAARDRKHRRGRGRSRSNLAPARGRASALGRARLRHADAPGCLSAIRTISPVPGRC